MNNLDQRVGVQYPRLQETFRRRRMPTYQIDATLSNWISTRSLPGIETQLRPLDMTSIFDPQLDSAQVDDP